jgi:hypothetical protein
MVDSCVCKKYRLNVSESAFASIHGEYSMITEYFIPCYNLAFNIADDTNKGSILNIFKCDGPRGTLDICDCSFPKEYIDKIKKVYELQKDLENTKREILMSTSDVISDFVLDAGKIKRDLFRKTMIEQSAQKK